VSCSALLYLPGDRCGPPREGNSNGGRAARRRFRLHRFVSVNAVTWAASLPHNGYDNNVSRLSENVVHRFLNPGPFTMPD
jgi:hypothetical protein